MATYQIIRYDSQYTTRFVLLLTRSSGRTVEVATAIRDKADGDFLRVERREINWSAMGPVDVEIAVVFATGLADLIARLDVLE